jgi:hypothetical protein
MSGKAGFQRPGFRADADLDIDARPEQGEDAPQRRWRVMQDQAKARMCLRERYQLAGARDVDET